MQIAEIAIEVMRVLGAPGIALVIAAEALFPPVPGEVLLPFAGVQAAADGQAMWEPILWTSLGSVLGGCAVYGLGRALGERRTRALVRRVPLMDESDVDVAMRFFRRFGFPAVAIARFVPMVRTFISVPAGIERMGLLMFCAATALGSGIWNSVFVAAGYVFGEAGGAALEGFVRMYSGVVLLLGLISLAVFFGRRLRARRRSGSQPRTGQASSPHQPSAPAEPGTPIAHGHHDRA